MMANHPRKTSKFKYLMRIFALRILRLLPADTALRLLFRLDNWLYYLQGQTAITYGHGIHPKHRLLSYHDFFIGRIHPGERVLDIGCGNGALAYDIAEKANAEVVGIDRNIQNIDQARQRYAHPRVQYRIGDVVQTLPPESFDVVVLSNVLEHLPDRPVFLNRVQQMTQASHILIRAPLFERDWRVPLKRELGIEWRLDPTHETEYTVDSFNSEISAAGLKITHQEVRWGEIWADVRPDLATAD